MGVTSRAASERAILTVVGLGGLLVPLNSTMIAVGLPRISADLNASVTQAGWLITAYLITMASLQPVAGKLGDRYGRRPFMLGGMVVFGLTSVGAALATNVWALIIFRSGQALSGAVFFPNGGALLREIVPAHRRAARFGLLGSAIAFGAAVGPPLGGVLVTVGGWPAIFWVNVPIVVAVFALGYRVLPRTERLTADTRFDVAGSFLLAGVLAAAAWALTRIGDGGSSAMVIVAAAAGAGLALFLWYELRHTDPVFQPRFFRRRPFAAATSGIALSNLSLYVILLAVPLLLAARPGWSEARIGLVLTSMSVGMVVLAPIGGRVADRLGRRLPAVTGLTLLSAGVIGLALAGPDVTTPVLIATLAASGAGLGLSSASLQTSAVESIERQHAGMATAANSTARYLGSIVGTAVMAGILSGGNGFQTLFTLTAVTATAAAVLAVALPATRPMHLEIGAESVPAP